MAEPLSSSASTGTRSLVFWPVDPSDRLPLIAQQCQPDLVVYCKSPLRSTAQNTAGHLDVGVVDVLTGRTPVAFAAILLWASEF